MIYGGDFMSFTTIQQQLYDCCEENQFTGAIYVEEHTNGIEYTKGFGYANRSEAIANTDRTRFGIASGCKIFTAVAVCQLVQAGKLSFDSLLKDCIDVSFPNFDPSISIHHLLTHCSGVPDYFNEQLLDDYESLWKEKPMYRMLEPADFIPLFEQQPMMFQPGERFFYNNTGYILLGLVVEHIAKMDFTAYVDKFIFQACNMTDSGYFRMDQLPSQTALGYIDEGQSWRTNIYSVPVKGGPDGGAFVTVKDMESFWQALFAHKLLQPQFTALLLTPHTQDNDALHYGYGVWILKRDEKIFKYFVMGFDPGVSMQSAVYSNGYHFHIIGNSNRGTGAVASRMDELIASS